MPGWDLTPHAFAILLFVGSLAAWLLNFIMLPGNWLIVGFAAIYAGTIGEGAEHGINWEIVTALAVLAALGELVEFMAGAAGAAKKGGSRRSVVLALFGALAGSLFGAFAGLPIPVIGPLVGALAGAGFGAFAGAYLGEAWKGRPHGAGMTVGIGAMVGRVLGTVAKLAVGAVMLGVLAVNSFA
ncbi:MAG: DUF456 domain-containing protein [Methyloligellaceae bacterium]